MIYTLSLIVVVSSCLYWLYKKVRGPMYEPGMVAMLASTAQDDGSFDDPSLYSQTTNSKWILPGDIELFYFGPGKASVSDPNQNHRPKRPILCLHGGPSIAPDQPWKLCDQLSDVYLYHARGCGQSTRPLLEFPSQSMFPGMKILERTLGIGTHVADVERIRRRLDVPKLDLVGHSFGAFIATLYASEFPEHVRSLTLLSPASVLNLPPPKGFPDFFQIMGDRIRAQQEQQQNEDTSDHVAEYEAFKKRFFDFSNFPKETEDTLQQRQIDFAIHYGRAEQELGEMNSSTAATTLPSKDMVGGMACFAQFLSMGIEHNYIPACKDLIARSNQEIPVAIVHGAKDMVPEISSRQYQEIFPKASFEVIPNEGHFLFDHPRVIDIVKATMDKASDSD